MAQTFYQLAPEKQIELIVRGVYEGNDFRPGGTQVVGGSVRNVQIDTPSSGWTALVDIDGPDGRDTLQVVFDGVKYRDVVVSDRADAEPLLPNGDGLTYDEVQRIIRDLDTQEQIDEFLATVTLAEDDEGTLTALLTAQPTEDDAEGFLAAFIGVGTLTLALHILGRYETLSVAVPEGWADLPEAERMARAQKAIANAPRIPVSPDTLAEYRDRIDEHYKGVTRGHGQALVDGDIDLAEYHQRMVETLSEAHTVQRRLGQGPMTADDEQALRDTLDEQLGYLQEMVEAMAEGELSAAQILDRSGRYGANGGLSFNEGMAAALVVLSTTEQRFLGVCSPHCQDCVEYAARGRQPVGTLPAPRQRCACRDNCCCTLQFFDLTGSVVGWIA